MNIRFTIAALIAVSLIACDKPTSDTTDNTPSPYITKVLDFCPAPGQYTNNLPPYEDGDTQSSMNQKVLDRIGANKKQTISLGGYGGYVVVGFNHTIENVEGLCDFRILGNAYYSETSDNTPIGNSCEPGIIMVSRDINNNGVADDPWYEIAGSSHIDPQAEVWHDIAAAADNDLNFYADYQITYNKPLNEEVGAEYISWSDNKGNEGFIPKNQYHTQNYFPQWIDEESLTFSGSRLPQNGVANSESMNFTLYKLDYGYADNAINSSDDSAIDISWAVDSEGNPAQLSGIDFIKIYTGVNQINGWIGECSTEISGVEDLHLLKVEIATR